MPMHPFLQRLTHALLLGTVGILVFVFPIPHTVALRLLLTVVLIFGLLREWPGTARDLWHSPLRSAWLVLAALTAWLAVEIALFSLHPGESWSEFFHNWLRVPLFIVLGASISRFLQSKNLTAWGWSVIFLGFFAHWVLMLGYQGYLLAFTQESVLGATPFGDYAYDVQSTIVMLGIALLVADVLARHCGGQPLFFWPERYSWLMVLIGLIATLTVKARNGMIVTVLLLVGALWLWSQLQRRDSRARLAALAGFAAILLLGAVSVALDSRWQGFRAAIQVALDIDGHRYWLRPMTEPFPTLSNGSPVEESAYLRFAWLKAASGLIIENPLGVGFSHRAFGWALVAHYGEGSHIVSSHSGLVDFTLAAGIPGMLLWLAFCGILIWNGVRRFVEGRNSQWAALAFFVFSYLARCALDGHMSGWRLELFGLVAGLLCWTLLLDEKRRSGGWT